MVFLFFIFNACGCLFHRNQRVPVSATKRRWKFYSLRKESERVLWIVINNKQAIQKQRKLEILTCRAWSFPVFRNSFMPFFSLPSLEMSSIWAVRYAGCSIWVSLMPVPTLFFRVDPTFPKFVTSIMLRTSLAITEETLIQRKCCWFCISSHRWNGFHKRWSVLHFLSLEEILSSNFSFFRKIMQRGNATKLNFHICLIKIELISLGKWLPNVY